MSGRPGMIEGARLAWRESSGGARGAAGLLAAALVVVGLTGWPLAKAIIGPRVSVPELASSEASAELAGQFATLVKEIDGRSLFIVPGPPTAAEPEADPTPDTSNQPDPKPSSYGGPSITAMVNDTVWFRDGKRLVAGAETTGDLQVVRVNGPWDAVVMWKGVEFTVPLFARDKLVLKDFVEQPPSIPPPTPAPSPTSPPPDERAAPGNQPPAALPAEGEAEAPAAPPTSPGEAEPPKAEPVAEPGATSPASTKGTGIAIIPASP